MLSKPFAARTKPPGRVLTVIIRNDAPATHLGASSEYRSIHVELTDTQLTQLALACVGQTEAGYSYEAIDRCFIE